ncbi:MAG: hypothetical protein LAO08_07935 [Acidobacteriia bacterium]|nr:hypothetical protein [Terriglobia bacterium]
MSENTIASHPTRAVIPDLVLTEPSEPPPSREDFLIAEVQRKFNARRVKDDLPSVEVAEPEMYGDEPEWERYGFRGQVGKLLWARGKQKKAIRFVSCNKCARPGKCSRYPNEHKYFVPNGCEVVFCKECAQEIRRELFLAYQAVILAVVMRGIPEGWVLARINFTLRSNGSEIGSARVKRMNSCVRSVMRRTVGARKGFGLLFVDEVGYEKRGHLPDAQRVARGLNLHCHGLYFGPRLNWERTRDLWMAATEKKFGVPSRGFYIRSVRGLKHDPARAVRWALNHMLKYVSKPPAVTPERLASLIATFDGARRVHSLGLFYGKRPKHKAKDCLCPLCRKEGILSTVSFEGRALPNGGCIPRLEKIEMLLSQGYISLRDAGRDAVFAIRESPP